MTLTIASLDAEDLAKTYGTPLYITDVRRLLENMRRFRAAFQGHWPGPVHILPAVKAGTTIALLERLRHESDGCDLFSEGEYEAARRAGFAPETMSLNGNGKLASPGFIDRLVHDGARITVDDIGELAVIEAAAARAEKIVPIRLRMRPVLRDYWSSSDLVSTPIPTHIAAQAYKAGLPTEDLLEAGRRVISSPYLKLTGLHTHFGRHKATVPYWKAIGRATAREILLCLDAWPGWTPDEIDLGGGFAGPGDSVGKEGSSGKGLESLALQALKLLPVGVRDTATAATFRLAHRHTSEDSAPPVHASIDDYARAVLGELVSRLDSRLDLSRVVLELEPGRGIYTDAGSHLTRVLGVKRQTTPIPWTWVITDTSTGFLSDAETENCRFTIRVDPIHSEPGTEVVDLTGISCNADRIVGEVRIAGGISPGDLVLLENTGAYNEQAATNFNSLPRPAGILIDDNGARLTRRRETIDNVLSRDVVDSDPDAELVG